MNENVRIQFSVGLLAAAVVHAVLLVVLFETVHTRVVNQPTPPPAWRPPSYDSAATSVTKIEKLTEPQQVNLQTQGELKQQGGTICPPGYRPTRVVRPVKPAPVRVPAPTTLPTTLPTTVPAPSTALQPNSTPATVPTSPAPFTSPQPLPPQKKYQLALCVGSDPKSKQLVDWFTHDPKLTKMRSSCEFQIYTTNNPLYRARFAQIVPPEQFPVVLFQDSSGGHVHAAGRSMIPSTASELYSDLRKGHELYQQARQAQKTGAVKTRGYSWDESITPMMYLSPEDCPDGNCPIEPNDTWRPGDRVRDVLFDEAKDNRTALLWASAGVLTIDGAEIKNCKDLTVTLEKAEADASTRDNNGWRATVGTLKDASIEFTVLNKTGDTSFALLQGLFMTGDRFQRFDAVDR